MAYSFFRSSIKRNALRILLGVANTAAMEVESGYFQLCPVLAEYPKSGGSLLFFLLTHLIRNREKYCNEMPHIYPTKGVNVDLDQSTSSVARAAALFFAPSSPFPPVKTHSVFDPRYRSVVCLFRDPLSVMKSYFRYQKTRGDNQYKTLIELIYCQKRGISAWLDFYDSYLNASLGSLIYFCDFSSIISSPVPRLDDILQCVYGLKLNSTGVEFIQQAIQIQYGQELENRVLLADPRRTDMYRFIGSSASIPDDIDSLPPPLQEKCVPVLLKLRGCKMRASH